MAEIFNIYWRDIVKEVFFTFLEGLNVLSNIYVIMYMALAFYMCGKHDLSDFIFVKSFMHYFFIFALIVVMFMPNSWYKNNLPKYEIVKSVSKD